MSQRSPRATNRICRKETPCSSLNTLKLFKTVLYLCTKIFIQYPGEEKTTAAKIEGRCILVALEATHLKVFWMHESLAQQSLSKNGKALSYTKGSSLRAQDGTINIITLLTIHMFKPMLKKTNWIFQTKLKLHNSGLRKCDWDMSTFKKISAVTHPKTH